MTGGWRPPTSVSVGGVEGLDTWPSYSRVLHVDPSSDITVSGAMLSNKSRLQVLEVGEVVAEVASVAGVVVVPAAVVVDAMARRLKLRLLVGGVQYGGDIVFLPIQESEEFAIVGSISTDGSDRSSGSYRRTDYVAVEGAIDIAVTARVRQETVCAVFAYDADRQPLRVLLPYSSEVYQSTHVVIEKDVVFIRACSAVNDFSPSLFVYFE